MCNQASKVCPAATSTKILFLHLVLLLNILHQVPAAPQVVSNDVWEDGRRVNYANSSLMLRDLLVPTFQQITDVNSNNNHQQLPPHQTQQRPSSNSPTSAQHLGFFPTVLAPAPSTLSLGNNTSSNSRTRASSVAEVLRRKASEGTLRLVGGRTASEGNVEIFYMGRWGGVCDDEWDIREGHVACRQLGFSKAIKITENSHFGASRKRIWMDNMYCYGDEKNLTLCPFDGWGNHDCTTQEAAGVICETSQSATTTIAPEIAPEFPTVTIPGPAAVMRDEPRDAPKLRIRHAMTGPMQVRIVGGRVREEGRVEVRFGDGPWGLICGDGWGISEAMVTCRMLGLGYANAAVQTSFFGGGHLPMVLSGVSCNGNEKSIADCNHDRMGLVYCPGRSENIAGIVCTEALPDLVPDHREIERSIYLEDRQLFFLQCSMEENCLARSAYRYDTTQYGWQLEVRRLLRFTASIANIGTSDFRPFIPKHLWQWHMCHMHYHSMEVFAHFDIIDSRGTKVAEGHKASFCLEDNQCGPGVQPKYVCANYGDQGISVGCTDVYLHTVDCQWIDITDVTPGIYFMKVSINPEFKVPELSYDNNAVLCSLYYNSVQVHIYNCTLTRP